MEIGTKECLYLFVLHLRSLIYIKSVLAAVCVASGFCLYFLQFTDFVEGSLCCELHRHAVDLLKFYNPTTANDLHWRKKKPFVTGGPVTECLPGPGSLMVERFKASGLLSHAAHS